MLKTLFARLFGRRGVQSAGRRASSPAPVAPPREPATVVAPPPPPSPQAPQPPASPAPTEVAADESRTYPVGSQRVRLILEDGSETVLPADPALESRAAYLTRSLMAPPPPTS